jgi:thiol-disulfide isomerase/thioredoxin
MVKTILYFGTEWCHGCRILKPNLKETEKEPTYSHIKYEYIDCDMEPGAQLAEVYNIKSIPVLIFLDEKNNVIWRNEGTISKGDIMHKIDEINDGK